MRGHEIMHLEKNLPGEGGEENDRSYLSCVYHTRWVGLGDSVITFVPDTSDVWENLGLPHQKILTR